MKHARHKEGGLYYTTPKGKKRKRKKPKPGKGRWVLIINKYNRKRCIVCEGPLPKGMEVHYNTVRGSVKHPDCSL